MNNGTSIIEKIVFEKLAEEISQEIKYKEIAKKVAPLFQKRIFEEAKRQVEEEMDFENWVSSVFNNGALDRAMEEIAATLSDNMIALLKKSK